MTLRYVSLARIDEQTTALQTAARRWYRVDAPFDEVQRTIRSLEDAEPLPGGGELAELLSQDGSLGGSKAPSAAVPISVGLAGAGPLRDAFEKAAWPDLQLEIRAIEAEEAAEDAGTDIILVDRALLDEKDLARLGQTCRKRSRAWAPMALEQAAGWFGPMIDQRRGPQIADLIGRWITTRQDHQWLDGRPLVNLGRWAGLSGPEAAWLVAAIAAELRRFVDGEDDRVRWHELELDLTDLTMTRHLVLPLPISGGDEEGDAEALEFSCTPDDLVDERTGIITRLVRIDHHKTIPRQLITVHAHVGDMRRIGPWFTDPVAAGTSFVSETAARQAAIGEAVERYSGDIVQPAMLRYGSWDELTADGEHAVDPHSLVLFSERQYAAPGFPFVPFSRDLPVHWVRGWSLTQDQPAWLPANLVYGNWHTGDYQEAPHINNLFYPGLAAGRDLDFAIAAGIQEIVERHSTMVWWHNAQPLPSVRPSIRLRALWAGTPTESGQSARLIALDNEFGVPVLAGVVENTAERLLTVGFAARPDAEEAAFKAWAEGLTLQDGARDLLRPNGGFRQSAARGEINGSYVKPWRPDRCYLDSYRSDFRDVVELMCQLQIYLDPRAIDRVRHLIDTPATINMDALPRLANYSVAEYRRAVEERGYEIFCTDLTTRDVRASGARVVRVLIPGLVPNFAAAFPFLGRGRLMESAVELGWHEEPLAEEDINVMPLPHA